MQCRSDRSTLAIDMCMGMCMEQVKVVSPGGLVEPAAAGLEVVVVAAALVPCGHLHFVGGNFSQSMQNDC